MWVGGWVSRWAGRWEGRSVAVASRAHLGWVCFGEGGSFMQPTLQNSRVNLNVGLHFYRRVKVLRVHSAAALLNWSDAINL
jgi:hypothetical protein